MKITYRIPAKEPYGYVEIEQEFEKSALSTDDALEAYDAIIKHYKGETGEGLPDKEFNSWFDKYMTEGTGDADQYARMSLVQQSHIQEVKKSVKRLKAKNGDNHIS